MRFETHLAWRYLTSSPGQTALSIGAVTAAVCIVVFINSMLLGMRSRIADDFVGSISHIDLTPIDKVSKVIGQEDSKEVRIARVSPQYRTRQTISRPERVQTLLSTIPKIKATAKLVSGQAFLIKGQKQFSLTIKACQPAEYEAISGLEQDLVAGRWIDLSSGQVVLGYILCEELGIRINDRISIRSSEGYSDTFRVVGIYDTGNDQQDRKLGYISLSSGQRLFRTGNNVNSVAIKLYNPWLADEVAAILRPALSYEVRSWLDEQVKIKQMIRTQDATRLWLSGFSLMTSVFAIAAVLIVSVRGRTRQIGILKGMGASDQLILRVFTLQGLFLAILGSLSGAISSILLLLYLKRFELVARFGKTEPLMPAQIQPDVILSTVIVAILCTLLAAVIPALQAARVNPVEAING